MSICEYIRTRYVLGTIELESIQGRSLKFEVDHNEEGDRRDRLHAYTDVKNHLFPPDALQYRESLRCNLEIILHIDHLYTRSVPQTLHRSS